MRAWRFPMLLAVPALLIAAFVIDRERDAEEVATTDIRAAVSVAPGPSALSSTWYCAAGTATGEDDGAAEHTVHVVNASADPVAGRVTAYPSEGEPATTEIEIGALGRVDVAIHDLVQAPFAAALVEIDSGDVAVQHEVVGPLGRSLGACATTPASRWMFPAATTQGGVQLLLALFNPFTADAVVDVAFETDDGARTPQAYQGLVVPAEGVVVLDVHDVVTLRNELATTVTVRAGRLVAEQLQISEGSDEPPEPDEPDEGDETGEAAQDEAPPEGQEFLGGVSAPVPPGMSLLLGAPLTADTWVFPDGIGADGYDERFVVFNPGDVSADVEIEVVLDDAEGNGVAEPFEVQVSPGRYAVVETFDDGRVPIGVAHGAVVRSTNGVGVVAQRVIAGLEDEGAVQPGLSYTMGAPVVAGRWLAPAASLPGASAAALIVFNPSPNSTATVTVRAIGGGRDEVVDDVDGVELAPGGRLVFDIGDDALGFESLGLAVEADGAVAVETRFGFADEADITYLVAVPVSGSITAPAGPPGGPVEGG
jgi:hypothetical protein